MKVGITIQIVKDRSLFVNGIALNCLMFYDVVKKIDFVDDVYIVNTSKEKLTETEVAKLTWLKDYNLINWDGDVREKIDFLITLGSVPHDTDLKWFKQKEGNKIVGYKGGNSFILHMEELLFNGKINDDNNTTKNGILKTREFDEIWMVPQQEYHNKQYLEIQHNCKARSVPFVWSPKFIENDAKVYEGTDKTPWFDKKVFDKYVVACVEPNTSVLKNMLPILYSYEHAYRLKPEAFQKFHVTNATQHLKNSTLLEFAGSLDIHKEKKLAFDTRLIITTLLAGEHHMLVSHQWGNPLNYAYLDIVYFGFPLVHNAHLCQDIGYYYEGFEVKDGGELIVKAAEERKNDADYTKRHHEILKRYTIENQEMINQYGLLIKNIYDKNDIDNTTYDWKTNLLK
jgi:hypothetical protein